MGMGSVVVGWWCGGGGGGGERSTGILQNPLSGRNVCYELRMSVDPNRPQGRRKFAKQR